MNDFFASLFELFGNYRTNFSDEMYQFDVYTYVGIFVVLFPLIAAIFYYKVIDSPRYNELKNWVWILVGTGLGVSVISWLYTMNRFNYEQVFLEDPVGGYIYHFIMAFIFSGIFFFIFSLGGKAISINSSKVPF